MVIKPYGYSIWEKMQFELDQMFKKKQVIKMLTSLFSYLKVYLRQKKKMLKDLQKEAVVTHYRLKNDENGKLIVDPNAKLDEELVVRPTSEAVIWNTFKSWRLVLSRFTFVNKSMG